MADAAGKHIVISAVNIRKGGTLTVLRDCLRYLSEQPDWQVTALVHDRALCDFPGIRYIEIPWSIKGWLRRLWCEYVTMWGISKRLEPIDLWFSLHDTTPRVKARRQAVYCHASFPFMPFQWSDFRKDYKIALFSLLFKWAYRINVRKNAYLVCQQDWMRDGLSKLLSFEKSRIIVASPAFRPMSIPQSPLSHPTMFLYPATPDAHKNLETACQAADNLEKKLGTGNFTLVLTFDGSENRYAASLRKNWGHVPSISFNGFMRKEELGMCYAQAACLLFPSRTETWGLPISEFLPSAKPMLLADLPYAHETAAGAACVAFFPEKDARALSALMEDVVQGRMDGFGPVEKRPMAEPVADGWAELFGILMQ